MQQSISAFFGRYQKMISIVILVYFAAMLLEFFSLFETTKRHQQGELLSQIIENFRTHNSNIFHEYSDILTLRDDDAPIQFQREMVALKAAKKQFNNLLAVSSFNDSDEIHKLSQALFRLSDEQVDIFNTLDDVSPANVKKQLSYVENKYVKPLDDKVEFIIQRLNLLTSNQDYTFTNFILLVTLQTVMTLVIIYLFNRSASNNIILPLANISRTIKEIQERKYISTDHQFNYAVSEIAQLQNDLSAIAIAHAEMKSKEQGMDMMEERLAMVPVAAHNIISPISSIKSISEHIEFTYYVQPEMKEHLHDINNICDGQVRWLRNLLFLFNQSNLSQKSSSLKETLSTAVNFSSHLIKKKNISLLVDEIPEDAFGYFDQDLVEQSISCLLTNSAEAVRRVGGEIKVLYSQDDLSHTITIVDNGIGLSKSFFDGNTSTTKKTGHGIGVAFVRNVAMLHKPQISVSFANNEDAGANVKYVIQK